MSALFGLSVVAFLAAAAAGLRYWWWANKSDTYDDQLYAGVILVEAPMTFEHKVVITNLRDRADILSLRWMLIAGGGLVLFVLCAIGMIFSHPLSLPR